MTATLTVATAGRTHVGHVRRRNEDASYVGEHFVAVADGLGGHVGGDIASPTVIDAVQAYDRAVEPGELPDLLGTAVAAASAALRRRVVAEPELRTMGSTLVALAWSGSAAALANVGDSRAYRYRDGKTAQLTEDHLFRHLVTGAERVPTLPDRLTRFLDGRPGGRSADITTHELRPGDRWLLCSDGLSSYVPHDAIHAVLASLVGADEAAEHLIELALEAGGKDNVTVVLVDVRQGMRI